MDENYVPIAIVAAGIIVMPVIIIKLAKALKVVKDKKAAAAASEK